MARCGTTQWSSGTSKNEGLRDDIQRYSFMQSAAIGGGVRSQEGDNLPSWTSTEARDQHRGQCPTQPDDLDLGLSTQPDILTLIELQPGQQPARRSVLKVQHRQAFQIERVPQRGWWNRSIACEIYFLSSLPNSGINSASDM